MKSITLIFPHQLFEEHPSLSPSREVYMLEEELFFTQYKFHKQKLVLHRASMRYYANKLVQKKFRIRYIEQYEPRAKLAQLFADLTAQKVTQIHYVDTTDYLLERRLHRYASRHNIALVKSESPNFICTKAYNVAYFSEKKFFLTEYYIEQRKRFSILIEDKKPTGGKWTYDTENRKKMPATTRPPVLTPPADNIFVTEAKQYVQKHFALHYGSAEPFVYPITHRDAEEWLDNFLTYRLAQFGIYQDAMVSRQHWLFHSVLSPMLNVGLLSPLQIIERACACAADYQVPLNSLEGFIRQLLGWREYIRAVYEAKGVEQRTKNFWQHTRPIPESFWQGTTGIAPLDDCIHKLLHTGYNHHIERLMVLGNFMLLCEFAPSEIYRWFMEMYIDSYDWVMVPNVYGMSQFADGGLMSTKPYISGSHYILKMSNYKRDTWCAVWDALYWRFIFNHKDFFARNPRMSIMAKQVEKMSAEKMRGYIHTAEKFLQKLT